MKRIAMYLLSLFIPLAMGAATRPGEVMRQAEELYVKGERDRALQLWEGLRASGYESAALFYNLGNAYYESGRMGRSVLNYERAMLIRPDARVRHNLGLAREKVEGDPMSWPEVSFIQGWRSVRGTGSSNVWAGLGVVACWAALAAGWKRRRWLAGVSAVLAGLAGAMAFSASWALQSGFSVVTEKEAVVRVAPDAQSDQVEKVYEGWKVMRLDQIGTWVKIELPDGQEGWVGEEVMEGI